MKLLAKSFFGTEEILADELKALGIQKLEIGRRSVSFEGSKEDLYRANLHSRTALRILAPFHHFNAQNENQLYDRIMEFNWESIIGLHQTFSIDTSVFSTNFTHSQFVALKIKDAIVDQFRKKTGKRPSVDIKNPDIRLNVHVEKERFTVSTDSSGSSLHKRGYRPIGTEAPLNEALAASMLKLAGWNSEMPLYDPMCGSGTILIEAAMMACKIPPALKRSKFGFMGWKNFEPELWKKVRAEGEAGIIRPDCKIYGSDISSAAINLSKAGARDADVISQIRFSKAALSEIIPKENSGMLIVNPPYGERIPARDIIQKYESIGNQLKQHFTGFEAWILSGNEEAVKSIGLKTSQKMDLYNGQIKCKFLQYQLYEGSKKASKNSDV